MKFTLLLVALLLALTVAWWATRESVRTVAEVSPVARASASPAPRERVELQIPEPAPEPRVETAIPEQARVPLDTPGQMTPEERQRFRDDVRDQSEREQYLKQLGSEKGWDQKYKDDLSNVLMARYQDAEKEIVESARAWFEAHFAAGEGEVSDQHPPLHRGEVRWIRVEFGGTKFTTLVLPKAEFPAVYDVRDQSDWFYMKSCEKR